MADETVWTRHDVSGVIDKNTPVHIARHPVLGKHLVEVPEGSKPLVPELINQKIDRDVDANERDLKLPNQDEHTLEKQRKVEAPDNKNGKV